MVSVKVKVFPGTPQNLFSITKVPRCYRRSWSKRLWLLVWWYVWYLVVTGVEKRWNSDSDEWVVTRNFKKSLLAIKRVQERKWVQDHKWHFLSFLPPCSLLYGWGLLWLLKLMLTLHMVLLIWSAQLGLSSPNTLFQNQSFKWVFT